MNLKLTHILKLLTSIIIVCLIFACENSAKHNKRNSNGVYVKPSVDYKGKYRKGHYRKPYSTDKNAIKNRMKSKYYYHSRGKYMHKKK